MQVMFRFRQYYDLEDGIGLIQGWEVYQTHEGCSKETNPLVETYQEFNMAYVGPSMYIDWIEKGNFLTRTLEWMKS